MSERYNFNINDPYDVLANASIIAMLVGYNLDDADKWELKLYYSLIDSYNASQVGGRTITKRIQELPRNSDGTIAPCAEKQHQELIKMSENAKEYEEKHRKRLQDFVKHSTLVHTLQRRHKEQCKREELRKQEEQRRQEELIRQEGQPKEHKKSPPIKEKLVSALGGFGVVLYFLVRTVVYVLPFVMIGGGFLLSFVLISINAIIPFASIVFWIWGLVCAIKGVQDIWAIIYYVAFACIWIPFYISLLLDLKNK